MYTYPSALTWQCNVRQVGVRRFIPQLMCKQLMSQSVNNTEACCLLSLLLCWRCEPFSAKLIMDCKIWADYQAKWGLRGRKKMLDERDWGSTVYRKKKITDCWNVIRKPPFVLHLGLIYITSCPGILNKRFSINHSALNVWNSQWMLHLFLWKGRLWPRWGMWHENQKGEEQLPDEGCVRWGWGLQ